MDGLPTAAYLMLGFRVALLDLPLELRAPGSRADEIARVVELQIEGANSAGADLGILVFLGHSYGAYGMAQVLTRSKALMAGVGINGMYDLASYGAYLDLRSGLTKWNYVVSGQGGMSSDPWENPQGYLDDSPFYRADRISAPLLLIHGDDDMYPVDESTRLFSAVEHLGLTSAELAVDHGEGHNVSLWSIDSQLDAINRMAEFCDRSYAG